MQHSGRRWMLLAAALCLGAIAGCGYTVGAPFSAEIRSVYVPTFTNNTNRRGIEFELTEAVQKQIQMRSHFRLAKEHEADTKLTCKIITDQKAVLGITENSDARELQLNLMVHVTWEDLRTGKILSQQRVPLPADQVQQSAQAEFAPEVGQSLATADQQLIARMARDIVGMMEVPW